MDPDFPLLRRFPRPDHGSDEAAFVLVQISSDGERPLDVKVIGTEQESVFSVALKHSRVKSLRVKNSPCDEEEWETILSSILLDSEPPDGHAVVIKGVEAIAKVEATSLTITIQKRIEGITQRLGTISLPVTEEEELDIFEWCGSAIIAKDKSKQELQTLRYKLEEKDEAIKRLEESFKELVDLKNEHEKALLEKFSLLLNEKKLKIRDQQRLLSASDVDPAKLAALESERRESRSRSAGPSRERKRKVEEQSDDESDDAFEKMDIDKESAANESEEDRRTPTPESTADEASEDEAPPSPPPKKKKVSNAKIGGKKSVAEASSSDFSETDIPPKRELPFQKKPAAKPTPAPAPVDEGSETESDDEL
ncbi:hypothetical protein G7Y89_g4097 [Cudoniella acicularis]|uniref:Uncharacterized protein n=1 Tax=Cudoniella acicularis TaxID=354080 RepID=A0A8H4W503_9HELO|nr:hypothetical protein G7Y89_g4097 [Cudoniella acicularis]